MPITSLVTRLTRQDRAQARAQLGNQPSLWDGTAPWTIADLAHICAAKHIDFRQTRAFTTIDVLVVQCEDAATIKVRASMEERCKIAGIVHALAHIALGHTSSETQSATCQWDPRIAAPVEIIPQSVAAASMNAQVQGSNVDLTAGLRTREEWQAAVWAAHALVRPGIFASHVDQLRAEGVDAETACKVAQVRTGNDLNIPSDVVECWLAHYDWQFPEPPAAWLQHERKVSIDPNGR